MNGRNDVVKVAVAAEPGRFAVRVLLRVQAPGFEILGPGVDATFAGASAPLTDRSGPLSPYRFVSDAPGFVRRLARDVVLAGHLEDVCRRHVRLTCEPTSLSTQLLVEADVNAFVGDALADAFVDAVCRVVVGIEAPGSFDDRDGFDANDANDDDDDDGALHAALRAATSWLAGPIERTARGIEGRLCVVDEAGIEVPVAVLVAADNAHVSVQLRAPVPPELPALSLRPARRLLDVRKNRNDPKLGVPDVDDATLITANATAHGAIANVDAVLAHARNEFVALCRRRARIDLQHAQLDVRVVLQRARGPLPAAVVDNIADSVTHALALWRVLRAPREQT